MFHVDGCDFIKISYKAEATLILIIKLRQILNPLCAFFPLWLLFIFIMFVSILETSGHKKCGNAT